MTFFDMRHFPYRHCIQSQQPVHCTKPCGGYGWPDELPQYTIQCEGCDQWTLQPWWWTAAARWIHPLLPEVFPVLFVGLGISRRATTLRGRRGCSNSSQSLHSEGSRYICGCGMCMYWNVRRHLWSIVHDSQQIHTCSEMYSSFFSLYFHQVGPLCLSLDTFSSKKGVGVWAMI